METVILIITSWWVTISINFQTTGVVDDYDEAHDDDDIDDIDDTDD